MAGRSAIVPVIDIGGLQLDNKFALWGKYFVVWDWGIVTSVTLDYLLQRKTKLVI